MLSRFYIYKFPSKASTLALVANWLIQSSNNEVICKNDLAVAIFKYIIWANKRWKIWLRCEIRSLVPPSFCDLSTSIILWWLPCQRDTKPVHISVRYIQRRAWNICISSQKKTRAFSYLRDKSKDKLLFNLLYFSITHNPNMFELSKGEFLIFEYLATKSFVYHML